MSTLLLRNRDQLGEIAAFSLLLSTRLPLDSTIAEKAADFVPNEIIAENCNEKWL